MRLKVNHRPRLSTNIAKLIATTAGHMVASFILLDKYPTLSTSFVVELVPQENSIRIITMPNMCLHQAFAAKFTWTTITDHKVCLSVWPFYSAFALLLWTHFGIRIVKSWIKLVYLSVFLFYWWGKTSEKWLILLYFPAALGIWTCDKLKLIDSANSVSLQAFLTKRETMFAGHYKKFGGITEVFEAYLALWRLGMIFLILFLFQHRIILSVLSIEASTLKLIFWLEDIQKPLIECCWLYLRVLTKPFKTFLWFLWWLYLEFRIFWFLSCFGFKGRQFFHFLRWIILIEKIFISK